MNWNRKIIFVMPILMFAAISAEVQHRNLDKYVPGQYKHVIGSFSAGFFANFFSVINHLGWCLRNNTVPVVYWDAQCPYYQHGGYQGIYNAWEYYFAPVSQQVYTGQEYVDRSYWAPDGSGLDYRNFTCREMIQYSEWAHYIIRKFVRLKREIKEKIDQFYKTHFEGKRTVGIHLRGTDKYQEVRPVSIYEIAAEAKKYPCDQYFVATDDQRLLNFIVTLLDKPVIYYDSVRSVTGAAIHVSNNGNQAQLGEQVLIETLLLAKTNKFIHTCSNVSTAVHFFNPKIDYVLMLAH